MKRAASLFPPPAAAAFTLIEMIGVLAIMAIVASVLVPNVLRTMDRAAVKAEAESLSALGEQTKLYLRVNGALPDPTPPDLTNLATLPTRASWCRDLSVFGDVSPYEIAVNKRAMARVYLVDPAAAPTPRILILSSMRSGLALPPANSLNAAQFQAVWNTADTAIPPTSSWAGWTAWATRDPGNTYFVYREYLLIERVNLLPIYNTELRSVTLTLNNRGTATASYNLVLPNGANQTAVNVVAGGNAVLSGLLPRTRLNLYRPAPTATLNYTYVVGATGRTFDFDGTNWIPQ